MIEVVVGVLLGLGFIAFLVMAVMSGGESSSSIEDDWRDSSGRY